VSHFSVACSFLCFPIRRSAGGQSNIAAIHKKSRDALHDHPSCTWNPADKIISWKKVSTRTDQTTKGYDKFKKRKKKQITEACASHWTNKQTKKRNNNNERSAPDYADLKNPNNINNGRAAERKI
jgi:hypothetical protein